MNININEAFSKLDKNRQAVVIQILYDMLRAKHDEEFDELSDEDIADIEQAEREHERGETLIFNSAAEFAAHFGFNI